MPPPETRRRCRRHDLTPSDSNARGTNSLVCRTCGTTVTFIPLLLGHPATDTQAMLTPAPHTCDDQPDQQCHACDVNPTQQGDPGHEIP